MDGMGLGLGWMDLCAGLLYEHRFAMLIKKDKGFPCNERGQRIPMQRKRTKDSHEKKDKGFPCKEDWFSLQKF